MKSLFFSVLSRTEIPKYIMSGQIVSDRFTYLVSILSIVGLDYPHID